MFPVYGTNIVLNLYDKSLIFYIIYNAFIFLSLNLIIFYTVDYLELKFFLLHLL